MKSFNEYIRALLTRVRQFPRYLDWRQWEREKQVLFFLDIFIGMTVAAALLFMTRFQFVENFFNRTMDILISNETSIFAETFQGCIKSGFGDERCRKLGKKISPHIVFIDIDNDSYRNWGEPLFIPRDKIEKFLRLAEKNGARVVALDTLFDYPSDNREADAGLRRFLEDMTQRKSAMKIVFPFMKSKIDGKIGRNLFDDLIDGNPNFHRGVPYASYSRADKVVRYIRYYDFAKGGDGKDRILWGVPFLSVALFTGDDGKLKALEPALLRDFAGQKPGKYAMELSNGARIEIGNSELFSNRIRFALLPPGTLGGSGNLFAQRILPDEVEVLQQELAGKIVIIGTSNPDKEGWYETPVGELPGIYIIGNVANVLMGNWQVRDAPMWLSFSLTLAVILFASYMFAYLPPFWARAVSTTVAFALLIPLTYVFYKKYGIVINTIFLSIGLVVPVMIMGWKRMLGSMQKTLDRLKDRFGVKA